MKARPLREQPSSAVCDRDGVRYLVFGAFLECPEGERFSRAFIVERFGPLTDVPADIGAAGGAE